MIIATRQKSSALMLGWMFGSFLRNAFTGTTHSGLLHNPTWMHTTGETFSQLLGRSLRYMALTLWMALSQWSISTIQRASVQSLAEMGWECGNTLTNFSICWPKSSSLSSSQQSEWYFCMREFMRANWKALITFCFLVCKRHFDRSLGVIWPKTRPLFRWKLTLQKFFDVAWGAC